MNKHCYRIIYSRTQGELRVVSELARSCSTQPGQSRGERGARLRVTLRRALWLMGLALFCEPVFANGIVADNQVAPALRPEVITTQNGLAQVNINAPNQAGISHNQFKQFDVDPKGAILNNSAVMTSTQLAGYIQGNARLNPNAAPARIILNEVNGNNPSQLRGFLEVAGGKARVIVANPAGIVCDGCGTINAGRMTLTTGKPQLNADGSLAGYRVERGLVSIEGGGLNGDPRHDTDYVDILARAVKVNAGIWAKQGVSVVAGRNQVGADAQTVTALAGSDGNAPEQAIDMGQMGGMYSGYIRMIGTEAGVGVRNQGGHLQAEKTLTVSSEGKLSWQAAGAEPYTQAGGDISLTARDTLEHHGKLHSGGNLHVQSHQGGVQQSGTLAAGGNVTLQAAQAIESSGHLLAGSDANSTLIRPADLTVSSQGAVRASGSLLSQNNVSVSGSRVDVSQSRIAAAKAELTAKAGDVALQQAQIDSQRLTVLSPGNVHSQQAQIRAGQWQITADSLFNQAGVWSQVADGESRFALTGGLDNRGGSIEAQQLGLSAASLDNAQGRLVALRGGEQRWQVGGLLSNREGVLGSNGALQLDVGALDNQSGTLQSQSHLTFTVREGVDNAGGKLLAGGNLTLNGQGSVNNAAGEIRGQRVQLDAQALNNTQGILQSQAALRLDARQALDNSQGLIEAADRLDVSTGGQWNNRQGVALGGKGVTATAQGLDNAAGKVQSGGGLALNVAGDVNNQAGYLTAGQDVHWLGGATGLFNNDAGYLLSGGAMSLQGGQLFNRQRGLMQSQRGLALGLSGTWDNQGGTLASAGSSTLRALDLFNAGGEVQVLDALDMRLTRTLDNRGGNIISQRAQYLQAEDIFNAQGWMGSLGTLTMNAQRLDNRQGEVASQQDAALTLGALDNQGGTLHAAAGLVLRTAQDIYNQAGKISAQSHLWLQGLTDAAPAGTVHNAGGQLLAGDGLHIEAQGIDNAQNGLLYSQRQMRLSLNDTLDNRLGTLQSGEEMQIAARRLLNGQGAIDSQQQLGLRILGLLDNTQGKLRANQALSLAAETLNNQQGTVSGLENITLSANRLDNQGGAVISQGAGDYQVGSLDNRQGKLHGGTTLTVNGGALDNRGGQLVAGQALHITSQTLDNGAQGIVSSQGAFTLYSDSVSNRDGGLLMGTTHTAINARHLDNRAGRVQSVGSLALTGLETLDNRQGNILANGALTVDGGALALFNQGGSIQSGDALTVATRTLDNQGGTLLGLRALTLSAQQDYTHRSTDTLSSNGAVTLSVAGVLTNLAEWLLPGDLTLNSAHFTNLATLVGKTLNLTTGALLNQGRIEADTLTVHSDSLDNQATLMADTLAVQSRTLDNHGRAALMAATEQLSLMTGERLTNRDQALIYSAGTLHLASDDLIENRASNIEAEGDVTLTARRFDNLREGLEIEREAEQSDYSWHRYHYYWRAYNANTITDPAFFAPVTQRLTFRDDDAAQNNPYGTILAIDAANKKAQVQVKDNKGALTSLWVNYEALKPNSDGSYDMTFYGTLGPHQNTVPTPYHNTVWREHDKGRIELWDPAIHVSSHDLEFITDYSNFRERSVTGTRTTDRLISAGIGATLLSGGNMTLRIGEQLLNDASTISSNGNLTIDGAGSVINRGYSVNERVQEYIVDHYDKSKSHWHPTFNRDKTTALMTIDGVISGFGNVTIGGAHLENTTVNQAQISAVAAAQQAAAAERAEWERNPLAVPAVKADWQTVDAGMAAGLPPLTAGELALTEYQHLAQVAQNIPDNGLFRQQAAPDSPFLVVTDARFADKSRFLSSDYLLQRLGYDPSQVHKRLGDGYYEQRVVREQLLMLTGRPSVKGEDAMAQYQALMNNGVKVAADFHLMPGVALTPAQIAALQQDIVWLVSETVDTAQGPQTVWVPKVYLANSTVRLSGDGAVIAGGDLQLSTASVNNAGNLFADRALSIDSGAFLHQGGDIRADTINVQADAITLSSNLQDALRRASMSARDISLSGGDILLQGAKLDATNDLSLSASNNLTLTTARSSHTANLEVISGAMGNRNTGYLEMPGERMAQVSGEWQQALGSELNAGGNLSLKAGQDITVQGSQARAGGTTQVQAGGNVSLLADSTTNSTHLEASSRHSSVSNSREEERLLLSTLSGDKGVTLVAGHTLLAEGAQVDSTAGSIGLSAQDVTLREAHQQTNDQDSEQKRQGKSKSQREMETSRDEVIGSTFSGRDGVTVIAREGDVTVTGSTLHSEQGAIALQAKENVTLNSATASESQYLEARSEKKGFLNKSSSHTVSDDRVTREQGSVLSGERITVSAGNDLTVSGSSLVADRDVILQAGNNVDIGAATETESHYRLEEKKKSGLLSSGGIGFTIGSQTNRHQVDEQGITQSQSVSTVGSSQGNVSITAGKQLHIGGADLVAGKDLSLAGESVQIDPGQDIRRQKETYEQKSSGLTVALSGTAGSALNTAVSTAQQANQESDSRLAALQGTKAVLSGVQATQAVRLADAQSGTPAASDNTVGVSLSYGSQSSTSTQESGQRTVQGSSLAAGNNLSISATGKEGDIRVQGSQLQAGKDILLSANRDVHLVSGENTQYLDGKNESSGGSVGVGIGAGSGGVGISVSASVNKGKGNEKGNGTTHTETTVNAGNNLSITSGRDTTLTGAQVSGEKVVMDVGRNLTLTSEQDSDRYDAKQQNVSAGGSFTFGSMTGSGSVNVSQDKMHSNFDSVQEQTGIFAGKGGFDVTVGEHTQLNGAVMASTATADKNRLDTGTLGFENIENQADFKVEHQSVGISSGGSIGGQFAGNMANGLLVGANNEGHASSTTQAAVSEGTIIVRDQGNQQQDVGELSRDVEHANQALSPIFDKEKEQKRLKEAQLIGEIGNQAMDIARTEGAIGAAKVAKEKMNEPGAQAAAKEKLEKEGKPVTADAIAKQAYETAYNQALKESGFGTGGKVQQAMQAATAAVQGLAGGNLGQAISGAAAPYLAEQIHKLAPDEASRAMAHAVVGAVVAQASGNGALAGAAGAVSGELMAQLVMEQLYPGKQVSELSESERQTISALGTLAAGLAGGVAGESSADAVAGAQAGRNAVEFNYLSVQEKTELELAKQTLQNSQDPAEREQAQQKISELREKDIASDKKVMDACGNGNAGSAGCASARLDVIAAKGEYETGLYNSKVSQQYADAYGQIVNLLNITSVDAQNQQQIQDAMINFFMTTKGVDYATAKDYTELKQGADIIVASVTPVLGAAAAKQLGKIVDANLKVVAKGNVDGNKFSDTNQGARPSQLADFNKPTLINDVVQAKIDKRPDKNFPNGNMGTAHAEIGVIQQAYEKGMTNGKDMLMSVSGERVCSYCNSDIVKMAAKSGLKSLTIYEEKSGDVLYWEAGMKNFIRK